MESRNDLGQFVGKLGVRSGQDPISTKFPAEVDKILRSLPSRSDYIRNAVMAQMKRDGYLDDSAT